MRYHLRTLNLAFVLLTGFIAVCADVTGARARKESLRFPADAGVVNVTRPPYTARGDGKTDDTAAIQKALDEQTGRGSILYFPNGVGAGQGLNLCTRWPSAVFRFQVTVPPLAVVAYTRWPATSVIFTNALLAKPLMPTVP